MKLMGNTKYSAFVKMKTQYVQVWYTKDTKYSMFVNKNKPQPLAGKGQLLGVRARSSIVSNRLRVTK